MNVESGAKAAIGFADDPAQKVYCLGQAGSKGKLEGQRGRFTISGFGQIGDEKAFDDDRMNFSINWVREAVAAFNLRQEALGHEETLLFEGGWKHHIVPHGKSRRIWRVRAAR
jgi:hypothetical protein